MTAAATPTWFITGASSGLGLAFARYALERRYYVVATARTVGKLEALAALAPGRCLVHRLDVTDPRDAVAAVDAAVGRFGRIDVLVNNAGYGIIGAVEETPEREFRALMEVNFFGALSVTRAALPQLRRQRGGAIVNISSIGGQVSYMGVGAYSASKFALEGVTEALAQEVAPFGIKVMIVEPGALRTNPALQFMPVMAAYESIVGGIREMVHDMHADQAGDPLKAARAVDLALRAADTPLRLQIGADAVAAVRTHSEQLLKELAAWEQVAADIRVEGGADVA
jgi:NAD(P)-dependent dehydrogenase (short-subunit alcohol dehydrogenase family)